MKKLIIAIDGTAASGKSTTAKKVARHFNYQYVDTGAMYRAVTLKALQTGVDLTDDSALSSLVDSLNLSLDHENENVRIMIDNVDVTDQIRSQEVTRHVSAVSEVKLIRDALVAKQRELGREGGVVMEGRDIGTVVFPHADVKVFMDADIQDRAQRRWVETGKRNGSVDSKTMERTIHDRDAWDSSRQYSPLRKASDAQLIDTTNLTIDQQVNIVIRKVEKVIHKEKMENTK